MAEIEVNPVGDVFYVTVTDGGTATTHRVKVPEDLYRRLTQGKISKEACVTASFRFLLEREPKEAILTRFDLPIISDYFPEFENEFPNYIRR